MGIVQLDQVFAAHGEYFNPLLKVEAPADFALKSQMRRRVGLEYAGHWTRRTQRWLPRFTVRVARDQATLLCRASPVKVLVIEPTFISSWCNHFAS